MKNLSKTFITFFIVMIIIAGLLSVFNQEQKDGRQVEEVGIAEVVKNIRQGNVERTEVSGNSLSLFTKDNRELKSYKEGVESASELFLNYGLSEEDLVKANIEVKTESGWAYWGSIILPILLPILFIVFFIGLMSRQVQGLNKRAMSFGDTKSKPEKGDDKKKEKTDFKKVAGASEAKNELLEVVEFLKHPKKFIQIGARIPKGVLLVGPPGCGKTLLARAVAGEAGVPFFHVSGSEFVEMFVGVGASRVRGLFQKAKKNSPCIIFLDELDAVGRRRGAGLGGSHDEREQTLNQILVEMDGFEPNEGVIVIAATNRPDVLDPAILRPGRFDRRVIVDLPDLGDRERILKIHAKGKPFGAEVDLRILATRTPGFSGADLANLLNESAILAAKNGKEKISMEEILESIDKVMIGPARKSRILSDREKKITAYHEAGHAIAAHASKYADPVHKISIISRGHAGGYTIKLPIEDKHMHSYSEFLDDLVVLLGGYAAEKFVFGELTTGATSDLRKATELAKKLTTQYGMSEKLGPRTFGEKEEMLFLGREISEQKDYSDKTAEKIDEEIIGFINKAYEKAVKILRVNREKLDKVAEALLEREVLEKEEFEEIAGAKKKIENLKLAR